MALGDLGRPVDISLPDEMDIAAAHERGEHDDNPESACDACQDECEQDGPDYQNEPN